MLEALAQVTIALVRKRVAEGDCPVTPAQSVEVLENLVLHLAAKIAPVPVRDLSLRTVIGHTNAVLGDLLFDAPGSERHHAAINATSAVLTGTAALWKAQRKVVAKIVFDEFAPDDTLDFGSTTEDAFAWQTADKIMAALSTAHDPASAGDRPGQDDAGVRARIALQIATRTLERISAGHGRQRGLRVLTAAEQAAEALARMRAEPKAGSFTRRSS